jgi:uncharacterized protein
MNRRQFLMMAGLLGASPYTNAASSYWPEAGFKNPCLNPELPKSLAQHPTMKTIWEGINPGLVWDCHVHLVGTGDASEGTWFNPNMDSYLHPVLKIQKNFYMNAGCVKPSQIDESYASRLAHISSAMPKGFKSMLFAFDWVHDSQGKSQPNKSIFHVSNAYAAEVAKQYNQHFEWVASIHPYRQDALDALDEVKENGARAIKWLPSGMGIDPASTKCNVFYRKAAKLGLPIISHTGAESAVIGGEQAHGNPLRMRNALEHGVKVVLAHCASEGEDEDTDNGNKTVKSIALYERLMEQSEYEELVFGEISALTLVNHASAIKRILMRTEWHHRLLNGSDYPLPGIFPLINTNQLVNLGLIEQQHVPFLTQLKHYNPLLYDFAVKRLIKVDGVAFANSIFETKPFFTKS